MIERYWKAHDFVCSFFGDLSEPGQMLMAITAWSMALMTVALGIMAWTGTGIFA